MPYVILMLMSTYHRYKRQKTHKSLVLKKTAKPKAIDRIIYFAAIVEPLFSLPQSYQIFHDKAAANVSILAWLGFEVMALIWLWYGIAHKDRMILIYQGLFFIVDGSVVVGAIIYGARWL